MKVITFWSEDENPRVNFVRVWTDKDRLLQEAARSGTPNAMLVQTDHGLDYSFIEGRDFSRRVLSGDVNHPWTTMDDSFTILVNRVFDDDFGLGDSDGDLETPNQS